MIPQFFIKSSGQQTNFAAFAYIDGAQLIYDWGNSISYNPAQGASGITSNAASGSLGDPQGTFIKQDGGSAPLWVSTYSGSVDFTPATVADYYVEYNGTLPTGSISVVSVYKSDATDVSGSMLCLTGSNNGINLSMNASKIITPTIWYGASGNTPATLTCTTTLPDNNWNMVTFTTNGTNLHTMYLNAATSASVDTNTYNRGLFAPSARNIRIGVNNFSNTSNRSLQGYLMATLIYPFALTPQQIKQLYYVFRKRFS